MRLSKNSWFYFFLAGLAVAGIWMTWTSTPWGVRVGFDSYFYLSAAQNVIQGLGLSRLSPEGQVIPLTHYPPLYPLAVAGFSFLVKGDILLSARWTSALIFGINIFLFGYLCFRYTRSTVAGFLGGCFCLLSPILMSVTICAFSEGLFITFLLLSEPS